MRITHLHTLKCVIFSFFIQYNRTKPNIVTVFGVYKWLPYHSFLHTLKCVEIYGHNFMVSFKIHFKVFVTTSVTMHFLQKLPSPIENWTFRSMSKIQNLEELFSEFFQLFQKGTIKKTMDFIIFYIKILLTIK